MIKKERDFRKKNSLAVSICTHALAEAGFSYNISAKTRRSKHLEQEGDKMAAINAFQHLLDQEQDNKSALKGLAYLYKLMKHENHAEYYLNKLKIVAASENKMETL